MKVQSSLEVLAPPEVVFDILADLHARARFMSGLETWEHVGGRQEGEGARYRLTQRIGPVALTSLVEMVDWNRPTALSWTSLKGLRTWGRFTIRATERGSRVTFRLGYASAENLLGFITDRIASPLVRRQVDETLRALGDRVIAAMQKRVRRAARKGVAPQDEPPAEAAPEPVASRATRSRRSPKGLPREVRTPVRRRPEPA